MLTRCLGLLLLLLAALFVTGCHDQLLGTNDAELEYRVTDELPGSPEALRSAIKARLTAAQVFADVVPSGVDRVRLIVDADSVGAVDDLVRWRGGIAFYRVEPTFFFAPDDQTGLRLVTAPLPDGGTERYFVGPADDVYRAVSEAKPPAGYKVVAERIDAREARTRVVAEPPLVDLTGAIRALELSDYGRALAITPSDAAREAMAQAVAKNPDAEIAVVRGRAALDVRPAADLADTPLVLSFGKDIYAFARAHANEKLLRTPPLPPLVPERVGKLPDDWGLAIASVVLPMLLSMGWLVFVRQFDRAKPEPVWLVFATFVLGGVSAFPAGLLEYAATRLSPYLDPGLMTFGGQLASFPVALVVFTLVVGCSEEGAKLLGAWALAGHRPELDEPVDGIVYGCASALGFAAVENVKYFALGRLSGTLVATRTFMSVPAHMLLGAIWGYALGKRLVSKRTSLFGFFLLAALAHGAFDTFLSVSPLQPLAIALNLTLALTFVHLLRKALRHGSVSDPLVQAFTFRPDADEAPPSTRRDSFPMGARLPFLACAGGMLLFGSAIIVLGSAYEVLQRRVGIVFVGFSATLLALFGAAAWGLTQTIPLDAVVDERGLTYAGMLTPWPAMLRARVVERPRGWLGARAWIELHTLRGDMRIGPAPPEVIRRLASALVPRVPFQG